MIRSSMSAVLVALVALCWSEIARAQSTVSSATFAFADRGGVSWTISRSGSLGVGHARIQTDPGPGFGTPGGISIFTFRPNGAVASEVVAPVASLIQAGRIFAEVEGPISTAIAMTNPNTELASVNFRFTDSTGLTTRTGSFTIPANGQIARFLSELPFESGNSFNGTFTFTTAIPIAVSALRTFINERSEFLMTLLPVQDSTSAARVGADVVFPYFADGAGWTTEVLLANPSDDTITGNVEFFRAAGGQILSSFTYAIAPRGVRKLVTSGSSDAIEVGTVRVIPNAANKTPSGIAVISYVSGGIHLTQASIPQVRTASAFRVYAEANASLGLRTALVVTNPSADAVVAALDLSSLSGQSLASGSLLLPPFGQTATYLDGLPNFSRLPAAYEAVLRVNTASAAGVSVLGIRERQNERKELLYTTVEATDENIQLPSQVLAFPQIVEGGGYSTELALYARATGSKSSGMLRFLTPSGLDLHLPIIDTARAWVPTIQLAYPDRGFPGTTMNITLYGSNFLTGGVSLVVSGTGVQVNSISDISPTSMKIGLIIDASAPLGDRSLTVTTSTGTSNATTFTVKNVQTMSSPAEVTAGQANIPLTVTALFESIDRFNLGGLLGVEFHIGGRNDPALTMTNVEAQGNQIKATLNVGTEVVSGPHTIVLVTPSGSVPSLGSLLVRPRL